MKPQLYRQYYSYSAECELPLCLPAVQATLNRSQDVQYFASQQALLQKQLAELTLTARNLSAEGAEFQVGLRKKRLKLQQEVEVVFTQPCAQPECKHNLGVNAVMLLGICTEAIAASW